MTTASIRSRIRGRRVSYAGLMPAAELKGEEAVHTPQKPLRAGYRKVIIGVLALVATGLAITGCTVPHPDVGFYGNRVYVNAPAALWCGTATNATVPTSCAQADTNSVPHLSLHPGDPVQINVPPSVGDAPWQVAFEYKSADGKVSTAVTSIFFDGRQAYTLAPVNATDQLVRVDVQSGLVFGVDDQGNANYAVTHSWVLLIDPAT